MAGATGVEPSTKFMDQLTYSRVPVDHIRESEEGSHEPLVSHSIEVNALAEFMKQFTIFRVPAHIRESRRNYYQPRVVSIGPYHHGDEHLHAMEDLKKQCLKNILSWNHNNTEEYYLEEMKKLEAEARACYFERPGLKEGDQFAKMLLLDGCFVLELMLDYYRNEGKNMLAKNHFIRNDLLMLENQIPFFILAKLFDLIGLGKSSSPFSLVEVAFRYLKPVMVLPKEQSHVSDQEVINKVGTYTIQHLLHLHYCFLSSMVPSEGSVALSFSQADPAPSSSEGDVTPSWPQKIGIIVLACFVLLLSIPIVVTFYLIFVLIGLLIELLRHILITILIGLCYSRLGLLEPPQRQDQYTIPSATELQDAGITLQKRSSPRCLWDIHFKNGVLHIPPIAVNESIMPLLINLIAFEQYAEEEVFHGLKEGTNQMTEHEWALTVFGYSICTVSRSWQLKDGQVSWKKFTAYALFMDCIVNKDKDAMILQEQGVIENMLGSEEAIVDFYNHLCEGVSHEEKHYLSLKFKEVRKYCESTWRRLKAKLMREYFSSPWATITLVVGFLISVLTIVQTVLAILPSTKGK